MNLAPCPECEASVPKVDGAVHEYFGASSGCWALYGDVLAREYSSPGLFAKIHRYTVDAYAAQHVGGDDPRAIQSINIHLAALCLLFERKVTTDYATRALGRLVESRKGTFRQLTKPSFAPSLKVTDIALAKTDEEHEKLVLKWAESVWGAWSKDHDYIRTLVNSL